MTEFTIPTELLNPIDDEQPCGPDLEYDPEFLLLFSSATAREEAQYGDFVDTPPSVNWNDVERDARRLLLRSKDIRVLNLLLRARIQLAGSQGLYEGLTILLTLLNTYPQELHPQLVNNEEISLDESIQARSLALTALTDLNGALADIRKIVLVNNALRLQVRDVERALMIPRPADALAAESARRQLTDLRQQRNPVLLAFEESALLVEQLQQWTDHNFECYRPDFASLKKLLSYLTDGETRTAAPIVTSVPNETPVDPPLVSGVVVSRPTDQRAEVASATIPVMANTVAAAPVPPALYNRYGALQQIQDIRNWFEENEPSSPVIPLLRQAERLVGKRFSEVINTIPQELLQQWDAVENS